ncbi:translation initiation factor Sui1 [Desulfoluna spongiiphila]|uniref:Translation initiation factor 1 (eIF-1/SUI1) n=1 Tax=Desulfoluna spongiiphila TaxID=419481 RepID=A0A1G5ACC4_9BACT|nr:translation initiation factor Sui1 [Desulfoluna spongiiphila]SCX75536.1 translation initiation factor 1 (eIF-1/SUI1) [Desulfoluna spongiiphila]VVS90719.1 archaeal/bacterial translation initiation factor sui1 [Desulfoluna spongiiphila]
MTNDSNSRLVYSTETGRLCSSCGKPVKNCACRKKKKGASAGPAVKQDGIVRVMRETKGRKGKGMSLVTGVPGSEADLKAVAKELKQLCGTGGSVKNGVIEIQGDHRDKLVEALKARGFSVKKAGG